MFSSSPSFQYPQTPSCSRNPLQYRPLNSSPLIDSPEGSKSSPVAAAQARRKSQYKTHGPVTPLLLRGNGNTRGAQGRSVSSSGGTMSVESDPQKRFLRDRLQARCLERATKARERAVRKKRQDMFGEPSSDDFQMEDDSEEDDETIMQDELFRRIVANANRKQTHSYRVSYAQEVGSSFDPDLDDISSWEAELQEVLNSTESRGDNTSLPSQPGPSSSFRSLPESNPDNEEFLFPEDWDELETQEYAEEYERRAAMADFEDLAADELFGYDGLDSEPTTPSPVHREIEDEDGMDIS